jgi:6-phosphogluconate dehydrogenase
MAVLQDACILSIISSYAQGIALLTEASKLHNYNLNIANIAQIWKGGCIIRARLLQRIQDAYNNNSNLANLMVDPWFAEQINRRLPNLRQAVTEATKAGFPVPCFSAALTYIDSYRTARLPQNLVQAMRDCFGSHTYQRVDRDGVFHTEWLQ